MILSYLSILSLLQYKTNANNYGNLVSNKAGNDK